MQQGEQLEVIMADKAVAGNLATSIQRSGDDQ